MEDGEEQWDIRRLGRSVAVDKVDVRTTLGLRPLGVKSTAPLTTHMADSDGARASRNRKVFSKKNLISQSNHRQHLETGTPSTEHLDGVKRTGVRIVIVPEMFPEYRTRKSKVLGRNE